MADVEKLKFGTTTYDIRDAGAARDNGVVHIAGAETVTGAKTFSNNTTILNSGADTGYIGLNLSSSGSSIVLKKQSGSDTVTPVNITANSLSQYYGTSQTPYLIQLGAHGSSTDKVKISSAGSITINGNEVVTTNDSRLSDARTPSNDSNLVHKSGNETIDGQKTFEQMTILKTGTGSTTATFQGASDQTESWVLFKKGDGTNLGYIGVRADNKPYFYNNANKEIALSEDCVHKTGTEKISGQKIFSSSVYFNSDVNFNMGSGEGIYSNQYVLPFYTSFGIAGPSSDIILSTDDTDANIAIVPNFLTTKAYAVGDYVIYHGIVYKCTTAHSASAWNDNHFTRSMNKIVSTNDIIGKTFEATGSDYAEKFETLEDCPACRFVTLDGEKIKLAQPEDDYILGITSELPSIIGDKENQGTPVGLLGKLWVECDDTVKINSFVTSGKDGIATKSDKGYRVMKVDGNRCKVLIK